MNSSGLTKIHSLIYLNQNNQRRNAMFWKLSGHEEKLRQSNSLEPRRESEPVWIGGADVALTNYVDRKQVLLLY